MMPLRRALATGLLVVGLALGAAGCGSATRPHRSAAPPTSPRTSSTTSSSGSVMSKAAKAAREARRARKYEDGGKGQIRLPNGKVVRATHGTAKPGAVGSRWSSRSTR
jgi:hypothetical protein